MKRNTRFLVLTASALLVVVCLLAFGEQARHGHYHLDGGRGWDLPPAAALDAGHVQLYRPACPQITPLMTPAEAPSAGFVVAAEIPLPKPPAPLTGFSFRAPPAL